MSHLKSTDFIAAGKNRGAKSRRLPIIESARLAAYLSADGRAALENPIDANHSWLGLLEDLYNLYLQAPAAEAERLNEWVLREARKNPRFAVVSHAVGETAVRQFIESIQFARNSLRPPQMQGRRRGARPKPETGHVLG